MVFHTRDPHSRQIFGRQLLAKRLELRAEILQSAEAAELMFTQ